MRIEPREKAAIRAKRVAQDVARARELDPVADPVCCGHCADLSATARCHRHCPSAAIRLSSDPRFPLEPMVTPLVFELKRLGVFHPCWSCEGHNDASGNLVKHPSVWFYADSVVHIRVLATAIDRMRHHGALKASWQIAVTHSDPGNPDATFSLEPVASAAVTLQELQADLRTMADELQARFRAARDSLAVSA